MLWSDKLNKYYTHNHLNLCHKHFVMASKITIFRIKASFAVLYSFTWQFKAQKEQQSFIMSLLLVLYNMLCAHIIIRTDDRTHFVFA